MSTNRPTKPRIGITGRRFPDGVTTVMGVRPSYLDSVVAAGGVPVIIPILENLDTVRDVYDICEGIMLPGGEDVGPERYGETPHPKLGKVDPMRDTVELAVIEWTKSEKKPVLAICRGCHLVNVAFGGTLYQDIDTQRPEHPSHGISRWDAAHHTLSLTPHSRLANLLGTTECGVNSLHHQAVKRLGEGLVATGTTPDGLIESFETTNDHFLIGTQCHPEALWQGTCAHWIKLFEGLIHAARGWNPR